MPHLLVLSLIVLMVRSIFLRQLTAFLVRHTIIGKLFFGITNQQTEVLTYLKDTKIIGSGIISQKNIVI